MIQLESYRLPGYFRWFKQNDNKLYTATLLVALPAAIVDAAYTFLRNQLPDASAWWGYAVSAVLVVSALIFMSQQKRQPAKKPLVYTARVKRLVAAIVVLEALVLAVATVVMYFYNASAIFLALRLALYALVLLMPFWVALAAAVMQPIERAIAKKYFKEAQRNILENEALIRIGITGSYGKTSTKFILGTILGEKYRVLVTPSSYNTPMGAVSYTHLKKHKTLKRAIIGMAAGALCMSVVGMLANYYILIPVAFPGNALSGMSTAAVPIAGALGAGQMGFLGAYVIFGVLPFNLIKAVLVSLLTGVLYKRLSGILHR